MYYSGIHLYVPDGFQDGSQAVVEPLARPCVIVLSPTGEPESELAQLLSSFRKAIIRLQPYAFVIGSVYGMAIRRVNN